MSSDKETPPPTSTTTRRRLVPRLPVFLACALLAIGGVAFNYFWLSRPIGSGPAGPAVSAAFFAKSWSTNPVILVGLGDSVTDGFGARKNYSYFDRLVENPPDEYPELRGLCLKTVFPSLTVTNLSASGTTSFQLIERQLNRLPVVASNAIGLVVITTGGNDLIHNYGRTPPTAEAMYGATMEQAQPWIAGFSNRLEIIRLRVETVFPAGYHIFIADIFDPTDGQSDAQHAGLPAWKDGARILEAYNQVIYQFAAHNPRVHVVKVHDAFLGHGIHCTQFWSGHYHAADPHYWYFENLEDPNERGYDAIRRLFLLEIARVFAEKN